jgi:hypothetical protein
MRRSWHLMMPLHIAQSGYLPRAALGDKLASVVVPRITHIKYQVS